jgi:hypothetical protein
LIDVGRDPRFRDRAASLFVLIVAVNPRRTVKPVVDHWSLLFLLTREIEGIDFHGSTVGLPPSLDYGLRSLARNGGLCVSMFYAARLAAATMI